MDKIIEVLEEPKENKNTKYTGIYDGIYKVLYQGWRGNTYEAYLTPEEYKVRILKQKFRFELKVPEKLIDEFEQAVRDSKEEQDSWNDDL